MSPITASRNDHQATDAAIRSAAVAARRQALDDAARQLDALTRALGDLRRHLRATGIVQAGRADRYGLAPQPSGGTSLDGLARTGTAGPLTQVGGTTVPLGLRAHVVNEPSGSPAEL